MKAFIKGLSLLVLIVCLLGCSRKKNTFLSRNWHAITAEYNTLYNGRLALELGRQELIKNYRDNYWAILPVERMQLREEIVLPGDSRNPNFVIAEEKAVKAIQKHSMLIDGRERNPQIDEAYLLLGKARYYDQRFVPAVEAFNYILHKYPLSNTINQARIWREKSNIRFGFNELAKENLKEILEQESLKDSERADAFAMLAQAHMNLMEMDSAIAPIKLAAELTNSNNKKGRYLFIKGQLYNYLQMRDSAMVAFNEVIDMNRKIPRTYLINAHIAKIRNLDKVEDRDAILEILAELERDRENRPFLNKIYFQLAEFHYAMDSTSLAIDYYNKSLRSPVEDAFLQSLNYETLGNINFDAANYKIAGAYYDSTLVRLPQNTREYRIIKQKRDNLEDVIHYEEIAKRNDSILYLVDLSEEERLDYFINYTEKLKAEAQALASEAASNGSSEPINIFEKRSRGIPGVPNPANAFYFYNPTAMAYGKQEFFRMWGDRPLTDNWRTGGTSFLSQGNEEVVVEEEVVHADNPLYDPETYISQIPEDQEILDSLLKERNFAYYQLGLIYKEKFDEDELAAEKLEILLESEPEERLILPAKYNLYKIYSKIGALAKAAAIKSDIIHQYPQSRYAAILQDPNALTEDDDSPEAVYNRIYALFEEQEFEEVIHKSEEMSRRYTGDGIVPKFELLKAMAIGRLHGFDAYKEALNYVALNYPQTEEGQKAQELYSEALPALAKNEFQQDSLSDSFKLVFPFEKTEIQEASDFKKSLQEILKELEYAYLEVSVDIYDPQKIFVVVHGFESAGRTLGFAELLSGNKEYQIDKNSFYISSPNYQIVQIHKNVEKYLKEY